MQVVLAFCGGAQAEIEKCNALAFSFSSVLHVVIAFCSWTLDLSLVIAGRLSLVYVYIYIEMLIDIYIYTDTHTSVYVFIYP